MSRPAPARPARLPEFARKGGLLDPAAHALKQLLRAGGLNTVCEEARCPNLGECFTRGTATFMLAGDHCTRRCGYCSVSTRKPLPLDPGEPERVAHAAARLGLRYVVLTAVARDDLPDGGAGHFAATLRALRRGAPRARVEVLVPDLRGDRAALATLLEAEPDVFNHNLETAARLFPSLRPQGDYALSLELLAQARRLRPGQVTKSGLMVGLGESDAEVLEALRDLRAAQVDVVTLGQYLRPSREHAPVARYVSPEGFAAYAEQARAMGFPAVYSGVFVRSSYNAEEVATRHAARLAGAAPCGPGQPPTPGRPGDTAT